MAVEACNGSPSALAAKLGAKVVRQNVEYWLASGRIPAEHCPAIERVMVDMGVDVTRRHLRPHDWHLIWPELVTDEHPAPKPAKKPAKKPGKVAA